MCNRHAVISYVATNVDSSAHIHKPTNEILIQPLLKRVMLSAGNHDHPVYAAAIELNEVLLSLLLILSIHLLKNGTYECTVYVLLNFILRNYDDY